ncbi:NAD(P)-binding protein [Acidiphilium sp.]|uniref:NAD(P)-binding protein n=1 Tax=Acidiphilium sp. TaxID=527 RepID=UPI003D0246F1
MAILGGGIGALAAAYELTLQPDWQDRFDITVHQLGWRLGGKGASSRNPAAADRIEEHGLHVWAGFYENAFALMRRAYADRPASGSPIQTVEQAFLPENHAVLAQLFRGRWMPWQMYFPPLLPGRPGDGAGAPAPTPTEHLVHLLALLGQRHDDLPMTTQALLAAPEAVARMQARLVAVPSSAAAGDSLPHLAHRIGLEILAGAIARDAARDTIGEVLKLLRDLLDEARKLLVDPEIGVVRILSEIDLICAVLTCMVSEDVLTQGFAVLDHYELADVLTRYGAWPETVDSPMIAAAYDYVFAYPNGDRCRPTLSATSAFEGFMRLLFTARGALFFKMAAGAGEIIFAPLYQALLARGVRFAFFNRVLELTVANGRIDTIRIAIQATAKTTYEPLVTIGGLACWPAEPLYDQLTNGDTLKRDGIDLEDDWDHYALEEITLHADTDFDDVVLAIPAGALASLTRSLAAADPAWQAMLSATITTATQAMQLWLDCTTADLGGAFVVPPDNPDPVGLTMTGYVKPFDTWADMSHLLAREDWGGQPPRSLAYFCAVLPEPKTPPGNDPQPAADRAAHDSALQTLAEIGPIWPALVGSDGFRWNVLHAGANRVGAARLDDQYIRANITGTERYVLSPPGCLKTRLPPAPDGFANLYLAGDWVKVDQINAGCMEVAAMAGIGAATALATRHPHAAI